jgi:hypothetical protein
MSFSRRLTAATSDSGAIKENQILMQNHLYNRLLDISTGGIIILRVIKELNENPNDNKEFYVTVVGSHNQPSDVLMHRTVTDFLGESQTFRFTLVRSLPTLTDINVKILENDFSMIDPRQKIQAHLEDYHILYEGMQFAIPSDIDMMFAIVRIESLKPSNICVVPNGEVNFEIVNDNPEPLHIPEQPSYQVDEPIHESPLMQTDTPYDFNAMRAALFPDLASAPMPTGHKIATEENVVSLTKEQLREARLAYYSKNNDTPK